jgi:hypothetical protein
MTPLAPKPGVILTVQKICKNIGPSDYSILRLEQPPGGGQSPCLKLWAGRCARRCPPMRLCGREKGQG